MGTDPEIDRRQQILNAALTLFAERGFHRTTTRDVARAAGVAEGTIYNHFENKAALLLGLLDPLNESDRRESDLARLQTIDVRQSFRLYFAHRWAVFDDENLKIMRVVLSEALVDPAVRALYLERIIAPTFALAEPYFARRAAAGDLNMADVPLTLRAIASTFLGLVTLRLLGDQPLQDGWEAVPDLLTTLLLDGLLPREGDPDGVDGTT